MILGLHPRQRDTRCNVIETLRLLLGGFLMGSADLVPGVSGGTIALVIGVYERLIGSIKEASSAIGDLLKGDITGFTSHLRRVDWGFLISLLAGILVAVITLSRVLAHQLETNAEIMAGGFLGLVVGSVLIAWRRIREPRALHLIVGTVVAAGLFLVLGLGEGGSVIDPTLAVYLGAGALAICAMILPGISGSLILLLVGMYSPVLAAVNDRDLVALGVFVAGAAIGLALFSQFLNWALRKHHDTMMAALVGLMAGSLRVLWPWPDGVDSSALGPPDSNVAGVLIAAVVGLGLVFLISRLALSAEAVSEPQPASRP